MTRAKSIPISFLRRSNNIDPTCKARRNTKSTLHSTRTNSNHRDPKTINYDLLRIPQLPISFSNQIDHTNIYGANFSTPKDTFETNPDGRRDLLDTSGKDGFERRHEWRRRTRAGATRFSRSADSTQHHHGRKHGGRRGTDFQLQRFLR